MTPTETLRAADRIEELLLVVTPGWWKADVYEVYGNSPAFEADGDWVAETDQPKDPERADGNAMWIATMDPLVGAALVAWLRSEQRLADQLSLAGTKQAEVWVPEALAVARAILGEHKETD